MKIIHFADLHLGVEKYGSPDPDTGLSTRLLDILSSLDHLVEYALENQVDLVLFCGDAYKSRDPSQTHQRELARRIRRLSAGGIPVFLLVGNHDLPHAFGRATSVDIFDTLAISNVYVANHSDIYIIPTNQGILQIVTLPWPQRSLLLSREENKNLNLNQINERLQEKLTNAISFNIARLNPSMPSILAGHITVSTAKSGSEKTMMVGQDPVLLPGNIAHTTLDYVALGHIHRHQVLSNHPLMVYPGSLERLDFSEEDDEKGFYVVEIDPGRQQGDRLVASDFHEVEARRFLTVKVDINDGNTDPTSTTLRAIARHEDKIKDAIVRLQISLPSSLEGLLEDNQIHRSLKDSHYSTVTKDVRRESRIRLGAWSVEELTPLQALKIFFETQKSPPSPEHQTVLMNYAEKLIQKSQE